MAQLMSIKKNVDVQPGVGVPAIFHCSQGDKGTRIILGLLNNNDSYTIPEGTTAIIRGSRADGTLFTEITADIDTTTEIKFNLTEDMTSVAGPVECEAVMTSGAANVIGTANFIINVEKSPASVGSVFPGTDAAETWLIDELTNLDISGLDNESVVDAINSKMGGTFATTDAGKVLMVNQDGTVSPATVDLSGKANESTIAPEFDTSTSYTAGSYVYKNGVLYRFTQSHSGAWTGTDAEVVTVGGEVKDVKTVINSEIGHEATVTASPTFTDGYAIMTAGSNAGTIITSPSQSVTDEIDLTGATEITFYYSGDNTYGNIVLYDAQNAFINTYIIPASTNKQTETLPQNTSYARYFCMTTRKNVTVEIKKNVQGNIYQTLETKQNKNLGAENEGKFLSIDNNGNIFPKSFNGNDEKTKYEPCHPVKPLLAEMMADFAWCSMIIPSAFTGKNVVVTVSGSAGNTTVTASAISPDGLTISDVGTDWVGGVISPDGINFTVCNFKYVSGSTLEIYPALTEPITNGTISTLMYDSGVSYVGLHLTENGYKAYMQNLFNKNPKHCEVGGYIARFRPEIDATSPFTWYGGTIPAEQYRFITVNKNLKWLQNPTRTFYGYRYSAQWTAHTTKSGAYWDVDLKGKSGYLEAYIFAICDILKLPTDQELHIIVTIDGEEKLNQIVSDSVCRRIVVDYENATSGRLEVYSNKWYKVNEQPYGFGFGRVTWWVNDLDYDDSPLFPKGAVIAQEFDSWGVFHDGASGKELERLQNAATGVTVPYTNHSRGDQTSAWGLAWYYENVFTYHPSIAIHDFVINDTNSIDNAGIPATIEGPDEKTYNNKLTSTQYAENMILLGKLSISNGIQPIFMRACQHGSTAYHDFTNALIDALSEEVE